MDKLDRFKGCLVGGGAGDALGYTVEFWSEGRIFQKYGEKGITPADFTKATAIISDDTQMTLFTAAGLNYAARTGAKDMEDYRLAIGEAYLDWLITQEGMGARPERGNWLLKEARLYSWRAPGNTCLSALQSGSFGSVAQPINHSKGCGGVMRVAPCGLFFEDAAQAAVAGAEAAAVTHGHTLAQLPSAMLAAMVSELTWRETGVREAADAALSVVREQFEGLDHLEDFVELMERAMWLAGRDDISDLDAIHRLGEGWVGDEAMAIALYCALRYPEDFSAAITAAVNHRGDSDSTGAIAGNIVGAHVGLSGIPHENTDLLELKDVMLRMAGELYDNRK